MPPPTPASPVRTGSAQPLPTGPTYPSEVEYVFPPSQSILCPVCQDVCKEPLITSVCHHSFCTACIFQALEREHACPLCRHHLTMSGTAARALARLRQQRLTRGPSCSGASARHAPQPGALGHYPGADGVLPVQKVRVPSDHAHGRQGVARKVVLLRASALPQLYPRLRL